MFEKIKFGFRNAVRSWLHVNPSLGYTFTINELLDFDSNVQVNRIWYRGDGYELKQLYEQLPDNKFSFWGARQTPGMEIRKIHTGLPKIIVDQLAGLIVADMEDIEFKSEATRMLWEEIADDNGFTDMVKRSIVECLAYGDGAFKISLQPENGYPILEFYPADNVKLKRKNGRVTEITFLTLYHSKAGTPYTLNEHYGYGYVNYELKDAEGHTVPLDKLEETAGLTGVTFDPSFIMAEYMSFYHSSKYAGRGQSIFDAKRDNFDALDEAWSQWMDALRAGRTKTYIPDTLIPRSENGVIMRPNSFDNRFIQTASNMAEGAQNKIESTTAPIQHDSYCQTYITALDLCLQGIISPSTLGIDVKKLDNAEAQREKEKTTLYTRQIIVGALQDVLPKFIQDVFNVMQIVAGDALEDVEPTVKFGEYANPSFESQIEAVGKAKTQGIMSIEACIDELYGDTQTDEWKKEEVARIKAEAGIMETTEPALNEDVEGFDDTTNTGGLLNGNEEAAG